MRRRLLIGASVIALLAVGSLFALPVPAGPDRDLDGLTGDVSRGAYLARVGGCFACHTDAKGGGAVLAGGAAIKTEFGSFYAPNITTDAKDGIGAWSLEDFSTAMSDGLSPAGEHYYPAFPYAHYAALSDQDMVDLWAAFRTVPPAEGRAPDHDLVFPFNQRVLLGPWKFLFLEPVSIGNDPTRSADWNRGRWLAEGPGHCGACHTPRNLLGGSDTLRRLAGSKGPDGEAIPAITAPALLADGWTAEDISLALKTGLVPSGDALGGSMGEVVSDATRYWSPDDLRAIAIYLLDETDQTER